MDAWDRWDGFQVIKWAVAVLVEPLDDSPVPVKVTLTPPE